VLCKEDHSGLTVADRHCYGKMRPNDVDFCKVSPCRTMSSNDGVNDGDNEILSSGGVDEEDPKKDEDDMPFMPPPDRKYFWKVGPWQRCSLECGRGTQVRAVACYEWATKKRARSPALCRRTVVRPSGLRQCNVHDCPEGRWIEGEWSACSVTCGKVKPA